MASWQDSAAWPEARITWVRPHQLHVTLHFLGDLPQSKLPDLIDSVHKVAGQAGKFPLEIRGIQAVPPAGRKLRMFWAGLAGRIQPLERLHARLSAALRLIDLSVESRKYTPHVTLGRVRFCRNPQELRKVIAPFHDKSFGLTEVDQVTVYASTLTPKGPEYNVLERCSLGADPRAGAEWNFSS